MANAAPGRDETFFAEYLDDFFAECDEHLIAVRRALLELEGSLSRQVPVDRSLLDLLFRSFHTIKGLSGMVGVTESETLAHLVEAYLQILKVDNEALNVHGVDTLNAATKMLAEVIAARQAGVPMPDITTMEQRLAALSLAGKESVRTPVAPLKLGITGQEQTRLNELQDGGAPAWFFEFEPQAALAERGINVNAIRARLEAIGEVIHASPQVSRNGGVVFNFVVVSDADEATFPAWRDDGLTCRPYRETTAGGPQHTKANDGADFPAIDASLTRQIVRVDLSQLEKLVQMMGDLVITRSRLEDDLNRVKAGMRPAEFRPLQETNLIMGRQLRTLRDGVMHMRLVRAGEIFERMKFAIFDLARDTDRQVTVKISSQETDIDKFVAERMMDALLHLVRNAVSHGLESPEERQALGKPPEGTISLRAYTAGEMVMIEIEDDGRGIDAGAIATRASALGLVDVGVHLDDTMLLDVLCALGFSTRDEADRASGRGIGMLVARDTISELGGSLTFDTKVGEGTCFTIHLPLTLAIIDALIIEVGAQKFAVPRQTAREVLELQPENVTALENNELIAYRDGVLPLLRLTEFFGLDEQTKHARYVVVVSNEANEVGLVVDKIEGLREIVVRSVADPLIHVPGVSGATELGDGRGVLILDTGALVRIAQIEKRSK